MGKSINPMCSLLQSEARPLPGLRLRSHRSDEFAASYSSAGWSPPEPASASPAGSIFNRPAEPVNRRLRPVAAFSTGIMLDFQPELTHYSDSCDKPKIERSTRTLGQDKCVSIRAAQAHPASPRKDASVRQASRYPQSRRRLCARTVALTVV